MEGNGSTPELGKTQILLLARKKRFVWNRAEPLGQESYENAVDEFIERAGKEEAIELALSIEEAIRQGAAVGPFSLYPILLAFERRFGGTPELYVEIYYNLVASGGTRLELGPEYLKKGYEMDPHNRHVLWCMFMAYPAIHGVPRPSYTRDLLLGSSSTEHERECLSRILAISPDDELAALFSSGLRTTIPATGGRVTFRFQSRNWMRELVQPVKQLSGRYLNSLVRDSTYPPQEMSYIIGEYDIPSETISYWRVDSRLRSWRR